ncbi:MAG: NAD-dependent epimerase/dehydratase family protein [Meiothermus sp.]|nr:NAD-dependent epimerase/dehydratase family protein [Meiothermus sp.]
MKVFLTGATGYIGSVVAEKLHQAGHVVVALARNHAAQNKLEKLGYQTVMGALSNSEVLSKTAQQTDGVIHLAQMRFDPSANFMTQMQASSKLQLDSVTAFLKGLEGSGKPLIVTGGTGAYRDTGSRVVDEDTPVQAPPMITGLAQAENNVLNSSSVRGMAIRPAIVFGRGSGPVSQVLAMSRGLGKVRMTGNGSNPLSLVHLEDVADLYLLMLEKAKPGSLLNAVAEPFITQKQLLEAISKRLGYGGQLEVKNPLWQQVLMMLGKGSYNIFGSTMRVSAARARALGWQPRPATAVFDEVGRL